MDLSYVADLPWGTIVPIGISFLALTVSVVTWYFNNLAPFRPLVTVGFPVYNFAIASPNAPGVEEAVGGEFDPKQGRVLAAILVPFVFTHRGGRSGVVSDLVLRITYDKENIDWYFEPRLNMNEQRFMGLSGSQKIVKAIESPFAPIPVAKGQEARRLVLFQPKSNAAFPSGRLRVGRYSVQVLCRINEKRHFRAIQTVKVDFSKKALARLAPTVNYVPELESVRAARERLQHEEQ